MYHYTNESSLTGSPEVLISPETAEKIEDLAIDKALNEGKEKLLEDYINDPYSRYFILTADSNAAAESIVQKLLDEGYSATVAGYIEPLVQMYSSIFTGCATFLIIAIMLLTIINLFLSVHSNLNERKGQIGLMKALGYKTSQIFFSMYMENVISAFKAFIIGGVISALSVLGINAFTTSDGDPYLMSYVLPLSDFAILLVIALAVILIIPLICQLIMINMIAKIQPQEAMSA